MNSDNQPYILRRLDSSDIDNLFTYVSLLSTETRNRFGPHAFDKPSIIDFYADETNIQLGYIALDLHTNDILAYAIIKKGYLEHDRSRLELYGLLLDPDHDCMFALSVADSWQGKGLGESVFQFILNDLKSRNIKRIILWGGVQADNQRAVNYYLSNGFTRLGQFEYNGLNHDMILSIDQAK